jgi:hypothetical protein
VSDISDQHNGTVYDAMTLSNIAIEENTCAMIEGVSNSTIVSQRKPYATMKKLKKNTVTNTDNAADLDIYTQSPINSFQKIKHNHILSQISHNKNPFYLEIVSMSEKITINMNKVILDKEYYTIGSHDSNDCIISFIDSKYDQMDIKICKKISRVHCLIFTPLLQHSIETQKKILSKQIKNTNRIKDGYANDSDEEENNIDNDIAENNVNYYPTVCDNHSVWGTYLVTGRGVSKISTIRHKAMCMCPGDLLCIGLMRNGPQELLPSEANQALIVFRVRYLSDLLNSN